jgi:hypothetical protein
MYSVDGRFIVSVTVRLKIVGGVLFVTWRSCKGFTFLDCKGTSERGIDVGFFSVSFLAFFSGVFISGVFFSGVTTAVFFSGVFTMSVHSD